MGRQRRLGPSNGRASPQAATFLRDAKASADSPEACIANRIAGSTHWFAGEYVEARGHLERALALFQPGRDDDLAFRFGQDAGVAAMCFLALTLWPLGDVARALSLVDDAQARTASISHIGTLAFGRVHAALFGLMRGDLAQTALNAHELSRFAHEHDLPLYRALGLFLEGAARVENGGGASGLEDMRRGAGLLREQGILEFDGLLKIALAKAEAGAADPDRGVTLLDEAIATADRTGCGAFDAELLRARGEMLLNLDPSNPAPAEDALQAAIALAKRQSTSSFQLRAALALAKLYQSTARLGEAQAVLVPALEGFSPTVEMPEIAEARALMERLG